MIAIRPCVSRRLSRCFTSMKTPHRPCRCWPGSSATARPIFATRRLRIGVVRSEEADQLLDETLADSDPGLRLETVTTLCSRSSPRPSSPGPVDLLKGDPDARIRDAALQGSVGMILGRRRLRWPCSWQYVTVNHWSGGLPSA